MGDEERWDPTALKPPGQIILLHGAPRSGKSSILDVIQNTFDGPWMNLGFDTFVFQVRPKHYLPGGKYARLGPHYWEHGPGTDEMRHILGSHSAALLAGMYASIAAHSRLGFNVVADVVHPDTSHHQIFEEAVRALARLPVLFVGVNCPLATIAERRKTPAAGRQMASDDQLIPPIARWWDREIHVGKTYDLEVDTSLLGPAECAEAVRMRLEQGVNQTVFAELAQRLSG